MSAKLRWGIMGTGNIARQFAASAPTMERCTLAAVASRKLETAQAFAAAHGIPQAFGSYDEMLDCEEVDAVYISLPNSMHREWTIRSLEAFKHVLCEKPIAANVSEAQEMFYMAQNTRRVLMEAFMYRSHPLTDAVIAAVRGGKIGKPRLIRTSFCFRVWHTVGNIRFDRSLAGGALMDIGCYCINFSRLIAASEPTEVHCVGHLHSSGVDDLAVGIMHFADNITASFACGMTAQADNSAYICGEDGYIEIPVPWKPPVKDAIWNLAFSIVPKMDQAAGRTPPDRPKYTFKVDAGKALYALEADDFAEAVLDGKPPRVSDEDTIGNMHVLDQMRNQLGVTYP